MGAEETVELPVRLSGPIGPFSTRDVGQRPAILQIRTPVVCDVSLTSDCLNKVILG